MEKATILILMLFVFACEAYLIFLSVPMSRIFSRFFGYINNPAVTIICFVATVYFKFTIETETNTSIVNHIFFVGLLIIWYWLKCVMAAIYIKSLDDISFKCAWLKANTIFMPDIININLGIITFLILSVPIEGNAFVLFVPFLLLFFIIGVISGYREILNFKKQLSN